MMKEHKIIVSGNEYLWLFGSVDRYRFAAKVYDESSIYGIDNGRVSKLGLYDDEVEVVNYDRGWNKYPGDIVLKDTMKALLLYLADVPKWQNWREILRNKPYIIEFEARKQKIIPCCSYDEEELYDCKV